LFVVFTSWSVMNELTLVRYDSVTRSLGILKLKYFVERIKYYVPNAFQRIKRVYGEILDPM